MCCLSVFGRLAALLRRGVPLLLSAFAVWNLSAAAAAASVTIAIDASATVSESDSGDDLAALQNIFQSANAPAEPVIDAVKWLFSDLRMKRMRVLQGDVFCDIDYVGNFGTSDNGVFKPGQCLPLYWYLHWALDNGLTPHVALGAFMPSSFVPYGAGEAWPQPIVQHYRDYADRLVNYVVTTAFKAGAPSVVFEVSNELDIEEPVPENWNPTQPSFYTLKPLGPFGRWLWWINPNSYQLNKLPNVTAYSYPYDPTGLTYPLSLDIRRVDRGLSPVQQMFADAVKKAADQFPGMKVEIAGPAFSGLSFINLPWLPPGIPSLEEDFLEQMLGSAAGGTKFNARLDRFSFHFYGSNDYIDSGVAAARFDKFKTVTGRIRSKLAALGRPDIKLFLSEWGPTTDQSSDINYSHKGAAWAAAFLTTAVAEKVSMGSYLMVSDGLVDAPSMWGQASLLHKDDGGNGNVRYLPKPVTNVFRMFTRMTGTRRPAALSTPGTPTNLGAFVTTDAGSASIMVFNYNPALVFQNDANTLPDTPERFYIDVKNLPFSGRVNVQQYLVDANTSNLKASAAPPYPDPNLQTVVGSPFTATVVGGRLILPTYSLGLGVTLYRVTP